VLASDLVRGASTTGIHASRAAGRLVVVTGSLEGEGFQVYGVGHGLGAFVVEVHAVAAVQGGVDVVGGFRVLDSSGDIKDRVESAGATDPVVHLASCGEALGGTDPGVDGAREGADGGGEDLQVGLAGAVGQGLEALDEGAGGDGRLADMPGRPRSLMPKCTRT